MSSKDDMFAKVILGSKPTNGAPTLFAIHAHYPRPIHGEVMTHRKFSRNARSSRAVPVMKMIREVWTKPFVPWHWGQNQKGMQGGAPLSGWRLKAAKRVWIASSKIACIAAYLMVKIGLHKQIANRLLEPFSWIDTLISSTSWANFDHLRRHADAEPHFHDLSVLIRDAMLNANLEILEPGQWHLPYVTTSDIYQVSLYLEAQGVQEPTDEHFEEIFRKISVARCARISYAPFDGDASIEKEIARYELLVGSSPLHASPAEHQATPDERLLLPGGIFESNKFANENLAGNLGPGWIQNRKQLPGEYVADAA